MSEPSRYDSMDALERECVRRIQEIQQEYQARIKPYVDEIVRIRSMRPPEPFILSKEEYELVKDQSE